MNFLSILFPTILYVIFSIIRVNFFTLRSFETSKDVIVKSAAKNQTNFDSVYIAILLVFLTLTLSTSYYILPEFNLNITVSTNWMLLVTLNMFGVLILLWLGKSAWTHLFTPLATLFTLINFLIVCSSNIVQLYLILEVSSYTNLLFLTIYAVSANSSLKSASIKSLLINFLLNFIASVLIFSYIGYYTWSSTYPTWTSLSSIDATQLNSYLITLIALAKLGVGPWVVGSITAYSGYQLNYLLMYTLSGLALLTPALFSILTYSSSSLIILIATVTLILFVSATLQSVTTVKSLFAYSTAITYSYLFLIFAL